MQSTELKVTKVFEMFELNLSGSTGGIINHKHTKDPQDAQFAVGSTAYPQVATILGQANKTKGLGQTRLEGKQRENRSRSWFGSQRGGRGGLDNESISEGLSAMVEGDGGDK